MNEQIKAAIELSTQKAVEEFEITRRCRPVKLGRKLKSELAAIREAYKALVYSRDRITKSWEWLYDNYYIMEREGRIVLKELPKMEKLPSTGDGIPAVYYYMRDFCANARGNIDAETLEYDLTCLQRGKRDLESCELSVLPLLLRAALIEMAASACRKDLKEEKRELAFSDAVKTLNFLTTFDFSAIVEHQSKIEQILSGDPAGIYAKMDERSRAVYRKRIAGIAHSRHMSEGEAARLAVELARQGATPRQRHVGHYILDRELDRPVAKIRGKLYLLLLWAVPAVLSLTAAFLLKMPLLALLFYLPLWEAARPIIDYFILKGVPATFLPRFELEGVIPQDEPTLVVVSTLLTSPQKMEPYVKKLEQFYYSNGRGNILFGLLADLRNSRFPDQPEDKAIVASAVKAIRKLNQKYGRHFCIFIRSRTLSPTQGDFSGWERKRGAIVELIRFIKGRQTSIKTVEGDIARIRKVKYIITLDSDTGLEMDSAAEMVSVAMHPLNAPQVDEKAGAVTAGYGILAPRIGVDLESAGMTPFSRIMAGNGGVSAYDNAAGNTYQDLFGEGIYAGKGLINVDAFYKVLDRAFPEGRILSHDILEGSFLRAAFLSDLELTDGFPPCPGPWFERLHRWIRGDWQNIGYIGEKIMFNGEKRPTPLNSLSRFKLFDNLRRSLTPIFSFACLIAAAFTPLSASLALIAAALLSVAGAGLWNASLAVAHGGPSMLSRKYHCKVMSQAVNSLAQGALGYLFLPCHALVSLDAILRALWRLHMGKKLLEWTTSAESVSRSAGAEGFWRFWSAAVAGIALLLAAPSSAAKIAGAFFIVTPFIAWLSGRKAPETGGGLSDAGMETVRSYVAAMWRYYDDYVTERDHFLPPDNVQEAPVHAVAHRTSPTNIGLMMLSTLAARDFGLIDSDSLFEKLDAALSTLERMDKWNSHLYNWYDTLTLRPLKPAYVSTVDCGNILCCLTALREGLCDYSGDCDFEPLRRRIQQLINASDLSVFYNRRRKLFHIGYDAEKGELSPIYYDLLMSEARMTSYYAVARRQVPKRHWGALGRTLTRQNRYAGPISWTGTMFEYLMPHLLLPVYEDSLNAEALKFVIHCQKRRVRDSGVPWGVSESGFYAFDASLNYQYEAHGVQKLALKRGMDDELVVSPYSTFLALPFDPAASLRNLRKLEDLGMYGRCGFYEAVDFTYRRTEGRPAIIKSYMAHHVGMSIVACANALLGGIMQERFMRDYGMRAAQDLLQEKISSNAVVFNDILRREIPDKPGRSQFVREVFEHVSPVTPRVHAVSNGEYTMMVTDTGASFSKFRGLDLTRHSSDLLRNPLGIYAVAAVGGRRVCATSAPEFLGERMVSRSVEFNSTGVIFTARAGSFDLCMRACLHGRMPCEARNVEITSYSQKAEKARLLFYFEPSLAKTADEAAHPAFSRLFLNAAYRPDTKILIFTRRPRSTELPACLAVGLANQETDFEFELSRSNLLVRPEGISSLMGALDGEFSGKTGAIPDAAAALRIRLAIPPRGKAGVTLFLAAANSADEAAARIIKARREGFHAIARGAAGKNGNEIESRLAGLILPQILFPVKDGGDLSKARVKNRLGQSGLWSLGISGDYPLILFEYNAVSDSERLEAYIKTHHALRLKGVTADLAVAYREGGDYSRALRTAVRSAVKDCSCDYLIGARGGIHLVNLNEHPEEIRILLLNAACHIARADQKPRFEDYSAARLIPAPPRKQNENDPKGLKVYGGRFCKDCFIMEHTSENPPAPWCHILANKTFGTMVSDRALGFTWAVNSHENKLTPWSNDPVADNRGELLALRIGTRIFDLCADAKVTYSPENAVYESDIDGLICRTEVSVPGNLQAKFVKLSLENYSQRPLLLEAAYYVEPVLGVSSVTQRFVSIERENDVVLLRNPWSPVSGFAFLTAVGGSFRLVQNRSAFLSGKWDREPDPDCPDVCTAAVAGKKLLPGENAQFLFILGFASGREAALKSAALAVHPDTPAVIERRVPAAKNGIRLHTPDEGLNRIMDGLGLQILRSRIMGRTGFYQCGGAWGFRDQLQDCCAALFFDPEITKAHIYRCAAHQFREGDVMHWWHQLSPHDGGSRGVRTRCSDDMLWLVYTVCEYIEKTGDRSILEREIGYLDGPELEKTEEDRYFAPKPSKEKENVYLHCVRAVERAKTSGAHGIPLMGSGDWNDGMNLVGISGKGESVWLAMFLAHILDRFAPLCRNMNDPERAQRYREDSQKLKETVEGNCWDGEWYLRGFYDDGAPLGGHACDECRIDILPQSFSVIAGLPDAGHRQKALDSVMRELTDERLRLVRLFTPAFDHGERNPGYIRSYPPGIRENGGQYTHAAVWGAMAMLLSGRADDAYKILSWINPINRTGDRASALTYRLEPYVIAADIYNNRACEGRGGWSFYTGAAGWYYRTVIEYLCGIKIRAGGIGLSPNLPSKWEGYEAQITQRGTPITLTVCKGGKKGLVVDNVPSETIPLDGTPHHAQFVL